jgi:hypothetical protein
MVLSKQTSWATDVHEYVMLREFRGRDFHHSRRNEDQLKRETQNNS